MTPRSHDSSEMRSAAGSNNAEISPSAQVSGYRAGPAEGPAEPGPSTRTRRRSEEHTRQGSTFTLHHPCGQGAAMLYRDIPAADQSI